MADEHAEQSAKTLKDLFAKGPEFTRNSPLDAAFADLYQSILVKLNGQKNYQDVGFENNSEFVDQLLGHFGKIYHATNDKQRVDDVDLLPISLHDLRYLDVLINLIIFHGLEANLPSTARTVERPDEQQYMFPSSHEAEPKTLINVIDYFYPILSDDSQKDNYLRSVLLKGPLYPEMFVAVSYLSSTENHKRFDAMVDVLENVQQTYELLKCLTSLIDVIKEPKLRTSLLTRLSSLPVRRDDGVLSLIDFVTSARESEHIDVDKIAKVTQILVAKPKSLNSVQYFTSLFRQVREQLAHINRPLVITCLNDLVSTLYRKNPRIIQDFLFRPILNVLYNLPTKNYSSKELNDVINILISLAKTPTTEILEVLISANGQDEFYLHLWIYALFLRKHQTLSPIVYDSEGNKIRTDSSPYYNVILSVMKSYMLLTGHLGALNHLTLNLINFDHPEWNYVVDLQTQLVSIAVKDETGRLPRSLTTNKDDRDDTFDLFKDMDMAVELFIKLLKLIGNVEVTKDLFLNVLNRWVKRSVEAPKLNTLHDSDDSALILVDLKILEGMNKEFTSEIVKRPVDVLALIAELIDSAAVEEKDITKNESDSDDEDAEPTESYSSPIFDTLLDLLETILDDNPKNLSSAAILRLEELDKKLHKYDTKRCIELQSKIKLTLQHKNELPFQTGSATAHKQLLEEAMNNINDAIDPIKVQGLATLSRLASEKSEVVQFPKFRTIFLQHLRDPDPYVYLNAIKGLAVLCENDPKETPNALLELYLNVGHRSKTDDVLRIGEALNLYVQREGELFQGPNASSLVDACLSIVRQHDSLDNRIRMSAISLLGVCLRVNALGIQDKIPLILDCVFGILQLETAKKQRKDAFIVRRAAIHLVYDLLNDKGLSLLPQNYDYGPLLVLLKYAQEHEDDSLVREHAYEILRVMDHLSAFQI